MRSVVGLLLFVVATGTAAEPSSAEILDAVRRTAPSAKAVKPEGDPAKFFAGEFTTDLEFQRRFGAPPYAGTRLYLLPDRTYQWTCWDHLLPGCYYIAERGTWKYTGKYLRLKDDRSIREPIIRHAATFFPLSAKFSGCRQLCLIQIPSDFYFLRRQPKSDKDDLGFMIAARVCIWPMTDPLCMKEWLKELKTTDEDPDIGRFMGHPEPKENRQRHGLPPAGSSIPGIPPLPSANPE